jgi:hypothetical protein
MAKKKAREKNTPKIPPKLTEPERDLLGQMENGYQLETDSLGSDLVLRHLKDGEEIRPTSATRNTIKSLQQQGLISPAKGRDPLKITWRLNKKK